jgi:hypothetical protein
MSWDFVSFFGFLAAPHLAAGEIFARCVPDTVNRSAFPIGRFERAYRGRAPGDQRVKRYGLCGHMLRFVNRNGKIVKFIHAAPEACQANGARL